MIMTTAIWIGLLLVYVGLVIEYVKLYKKHDKKVVEYSEVLYFYEKIASVIMRDPAYFEVIDEPLSLLFIVVASYQTDEDDINQNAVIKRFKYRYNDQKDKERALSKANKLADKLNYELNKNKKK